MMRINVRADIAAARRQFANMQKEVDKAAVRALNRTAVTVRKEADQEIRKRLNLKSSTVKQTLNIRKAQRRLLVEIIATGQPVALREYSARRTNKGATFQVGRQQPRRVYKRQGRTGFVVPSIGGHVFVRVGPNPRGPVEAPIRKVYGPAIPQYFVTRFVRERMTRIARDRFPIEFARELKFRTSRRAA
jgi:hypothetical protein